MNPGLQNPRELEADIAREEFDSIESTHELVRLLVATVDDAKRPPSRLYNLKKLKLDMNRAVGSSMIFAICDGCSLTSGVACQRLQPRSRVKNLNPWPQRSR